MHPQESRTAPNPPASIFWIAAGFQVLALLVVMFGDIGFDKPGRFGLDYGHFLLLSCLWVVASTVGLVTASWMRRGGLVALQLLASSASLVWFSVTDAGACCPTRRRSRRAPQAALTPREVRNAIVYVLANGRKHAAEGREVEVAQAIDTFTSAPFSSAAWFDGFRETVTVRGLETIPRPVTAARTWMLTIGWRRHGLLSVHDLPATA